MSKEQPMRYGDVFSGVQGNLAKETVAPGDAALMQKAEAKAMGQTPKAGVAAAMQSAADFNERHGFVKHGQVNPEVSKQGVGVKATIGGQHVGSYGTKSGSHGKK
ncbi:late embryogenesis abundant protein D-34-like [Wolffia australiana]